MLISQEDKNIRERLICEAHRNRLTSHFYRTDHYYIKYRRDRGERTRICSMPTTFSTHTGGQTIIIKKKYQHYIVKDETMLFLM